jgi:RNA polymerase sigma-70 factor, ECF subfamily
MDPAQLVRMHAPAVYALCRAMVGDHVLAEDLAQDTFVRALAGIDGYRGEASPRTWLLAIARNRCLDHIAHARRAPWGTDPDPEPDDHVMDQPAPYDLLANRDDAQRAVAVLAETERALVVLHYGHGVGYPELADSFGIAQGAVRMRVSRALAKMRVALAAHRFDALEQGIDASAFDDLATDASRMLELDEDTLDFEAEQPTPQRAAAVDIPVLFPALYEEPSDRLWARLEALVR